MKNDAAYSGERTRLACWRWRLANANLDFKRLPLPKKVCFGGSPKPARESRALLRVAAAGLLVATLSAGTFWRCLPKPSLMNDVSFSRRIFDRHGHQLRMTLSRDEKYRVFTPLDRISPRLVQATLLHEDRFFEEHPGVNPVAALRAAWHFCRGERRGGASTITMQLARLSAHMQTRTLRGKLAQMLRALELERHYSKAQLLEAYLNLAPYGRNIEGVGAASKIYFGKEPAQLTLHEAIALSLIPQSPSRRALRVQGNANAQVAARDHLYDRLTKGDDAIDKSFSARAEAKREMLAPHLTTEVLARRTDREIQSTLDLDLQRLIERRIANFVTANQARGIHNAAALLVDFRTMEVLAQVGSADFANTSIDGQVDGTRSLRSPGSTLKPFVYALALDQGLIHPLTMLLDAPRSFGAFDPENFDREFVGPIKATDALGRSRNIPAVTLASELHGPTLYGFLKRAGVNLTRNEKFYGLALPLGGAEVTMEDLVRMYGVLANGGELRPLRRTLAEKSTEPGERLVSREAAFLTLEMLGQIPRPGTSMIAESDPIFWKTGTSQGFHDAWSIGVFDHYVLAVWVGNFDGQSNPAFVGRSCAAPLLFQIVDAMRATGRAQASQHDPPSNANLRRVEFCAVSGELPTVACTHRATGWFIPGVSPINQCEIHREILIDDATGLRVSSDDGTRKLHREVYEFWPSDLLALFAQAGLPRRTPPPFLPGNSVEALSRHGHAPQIVSPKSNVVYSLGETDARRALSLQAKTEPDVAKVYWFADRAFLGTSDHGTPLSWQPKPGKYKVIALDDHGRSDSCAVTFASAEGVTLLSH
jgi:penicillin-binding protein 1C